ncbi:MAG: aldehyde dehydrogenase family protein, partial [Candidatus Methylomirabilales bacterium]
PATEEVVCRVAKAGPEDVDRAVAAARDAFPSWSATSPADRARVLEQIGMVEEVLGRARIDLVGAGLASLPAASGRAVKKTLLVGNKLDEKGAEEASTVLKELYGQRFPVLAVSALDGAHLETLRRKIYEGLGIVRVYTKAPGRPPAMNVPVVLPKGSTILEVAESIHKDFAEKLKFARVWGQGRYDGQRVNRDYVVQEGDIIELHI